MTHRFRYLQSGWTVENDDTLVSPALGGHWEQCALVEGEAGADYAIDLEVTPLASEERESGQDITAGAILRYGGEFAYYYAGIGGWGARLFIGKVQSRNGTTIWSTLATEGARADLRLGATYRLRAECQGKQLSLTFADSARISLNDDTYSAGSWGLRTVRTQARFAKLRVAGPTKPRCFVIMPFTTDLRFVYMIIKDTVLNIGLDCHKADDGAAAEPITDGVWSDIRQSDLVIADLTGRNANVYYEVGFAHAIGKPLIMLAQKTEDITSDLRHIRAVVYTGPDDLRAKLHQAINDTFWAPRGRR